MDKVMRFIMFGLLILALILAGAVISQYFDELNYILDRPAPKMVERMVYRIPAQDYCNLVIRYNELVVKYNDLGQRVNNLVEEHKKLRGWFR